MRSSFVTIATIAGSTLGALAVLQRIDATRNVFVPPPPITDQVRGFFERLAAIFTKR